MLHNSIRVDANIPLPYNTSMEIRSLEFNWSRAFAKKQALLTTPGDVKEVSAIPPPPPANIDPPPPFSALALPIVEEEEEQGSLTLAPMLDHQPLFVDPSLINEKPVAVATPDHFLIDENKCEMNIIL
jgi:hypothetical protein